MAPALLNSTAVILSLICMILTFSSASNDPDTTIIIHPPHIGNNSHAMFLPLHYSPPHAARISSSRVKYHRHLQKNDTVPAIARVPLHDDLILNGYYSTRIFIGTPPQRFSLIVDTGSTITFVPCSTCKHCGTNHENPKFDPKSSSTYKPVKCTTDCLCDKDKLQCIYESQYAEMSSSSGVIGEDIVSFGNQSELTPQRAVFGCENVETGHIYNQQADGIMGLGRGESSIVDQLVDRGVISDSFSLCYGGMDVSGGAMVLGGIPPPADMVFADFHITSTHYYINLKEIHVAGKQIPLYSNIFEAVRQPGTILDSGTTLAYLPEAVFIEFRDAIIKEMHPFKPVRSRDPNFTDVCFSGSGSANARLLETFPKVEMVFGNGQKLLLSPENYMIRDSELYGAYCLAIFSHGKDKTTLLGGIIVRNTFVMYDREHERIGFWKTNCSEIWERLHISNAPPQVPPILDRKNSTTATPPTLAPTGTPAYALPGESEIGCITFSISLEIKYSNLIDHMTELAQSIAQELNIDVSQVYLLNFSADGNKSVTKWAVFPAESADSMSKDVATSIVSRIAENRVHLPETFGKYQFSEWKFEPPNKWHSAISISSLRKSRLQQHSAGGVVLTLLVILAIGISALWFLWVRRKRSRFGYRRVSSFVAESELQPL